MCRRTLHLTDPLLIVAPVLQYDVSAIVLLLINNYINFIASGCVKGADVGARRFLSASIKAEKNGRSYIFQRVFKAVDVVVDLVKHVFVVSKLFLFL